MSKSPDKLNAQIQLLEKSERLNFLKELEDTPEALDDDRTLGEDLRKVTMEFVGTVTRTVTGTVTLSGISTAAGGGSRGTQIHLKYDRLKYCVSNLDNHATWVPSRTRV